MTKLLDDAMDIVRRQAPDVQDRVAAAMLSIVDDRAEELVDPAHREAVLEGRAQLRRGEYATDAEVAAAFDSFDR